MKDTRFTELVNLYVDRQISPDEAAELELEIQSNPRRREVYQQYCRIHRATKLVYENFRAQGDEVESSGRQPTTIARIESRRRQRRARWVYAIGGLAAAACFALIVVRVNSIPAAPAQPAVQVAAVQAQPSAAAKLVPVAQSLDNSATIERVAPNLVGIDAATMIATLQEEQERLMALPREGTPARAVSLFDDGVFDSRRNALPRSQNNVHNRQQRVQVEFTAFQFQR